MIYYKICPLCQELCNNIYKEEISNGLIGSCNKHKLSNFNYHFSTDNNSIIVELLLDNYMILLCIKDPAKPNNKVFVKDLDTKKQVLLEEIPRFINWNNFDLELVIQKIKKIFEMQPFA